MVDLVDLVVVDLIIILAELLVEQEYLDKDMRALLELVDQIILLAVVVALVVPLLLVEEVMPLLVVLVFNFQQHLEIHSQQLL